MNTKKDRENQIPEFSSREEAAEWFDTHDMGDYMDKFEVVDSKDVEVADNLSEGLTRPLLVPTARPQSATCVRTGQLINLFDRTTPISSFTPSTPDPPPHQITVEIPGPPASEDTDSTGCVVARHSYKILG